MEKTGRGVRRKGRGRMYVISFVILWALIALCGQCMALFSTRTRKLWVFQTVVLVGLPLAGAAYYALVRPRVELLGWQFGVVFCLCLAGGAAIGCLAALALWHKKRNE